MDSSIIIKQILAQAHSSATPQSLDTVSKFERLAYIVKFEQVLQTLKGIRELINLVHEEIKHHKSQATRDNYHRDRTEILEMELTTLEKCYSTIVAINGRGE